LSNFNRPAASVEKVDHDHIRMNTELVISADDGKHFVLCAAAEPALPKAHGVLRHHGSAAGDRVQLAISSLGVSATVT
jgi:hypothetical protein